MKLGVATNYCWFGPPITAIAKAIESLGFESMWMGEHPVIPVSAEGAVRYGVPLPPNYRHMPDPFVSLAAAAAVTNTIRFGTNVCLVPQRNPIHLAKEVATLDRISGGRVIFAFGTGWVEDEAAVWGYPFNKRLGRQVQARQHGYTRTGGLFTPAAPAIITGASALAPVAARAHTNMGERR